MSAKLKIASRVRRLTDYISDIENGLIQVPAFQRDFIWTVSTMLELFNSLKMGYPIGTILLWRPDRTYGANLAIGPYVIPAPENNESFFYVLDGFQRISTLFGCMINPNKTNLIKDDKLLKNFRIYYDLKSQEFAVQRSINLEYYQIPVYKLIDNRETFLWQRELFNRDETEIELYLSRYEEIGNTLLSFYLPSIDINGGEVEEAIDIFWRLNSKGSSISPDWIVSARTYNREDGFRLGTEIDNLLSELKPYNFNGIKREVVLQCIQSSFGKIYFEMKTDEVVNRPDFRDVALKTMINIKRAVHFLYEELLVVDSRLLPASIQLIFITEFFNRLSHPTPSQFLALKHWFWQTTYSNYFTILSPSKRKEAFSIFISFLKNEIIDPFYNDKPDTPFVVGDFPSKIYFGSVRAKALVLFLLNYSNDFLAIDFEDVDGINLPYLFYDIRNEKGDLPPAAIVPTLIRHNGGNVKTTDMSALLCETNVSYTQYFITEQMTAMYSNDFKNDIIAFRKQLIMMAERDFVLELGLVYEDNSLSMSNS